MQSPEFGCGFSSYPDSTVRRPEDGGRFIEECEGAVGQHGIDAVPDRLNRFGIVVGVEQIAANAGGVGAFGRNS